MDYLTPIVLTGPESTGKSALGRQLARYFKAPYVAEYARLYLTKNGGHYSCDSLLDMARAHRAFQQLRLPSRGLVFLDTDLINYKVWFAVVCQSYPAYLQAKMEDEQHHRYLLTAPDIPWEPDFLRENPHNRGEIFKLHQKEIENYKRSYAIITGVGEARYKAAIKAVEHWANIKPRG